MAVEIIPIGQLIGASDTQIASAIANGTETGAVVEGIASDAAEVASADAVSAADIPGKVQASITSSPAVQAAVAGQAATQVPAAVTADIAGRDLVEGSSTQVMQILDDPVYGWAVLRGSRASLLIRHDARVEFARGVHVFDGAESGQFTSMLRANGLSFAVIRGGRVGELALDLTGRFPKWVAEAIVNRGKAALPASTPTGIAGIGDSLTHADGATDPYMKLVADAFGRPYYNGGWSGQSVEHIAARQNGVPAVMTFPSNTIPAAATPVTVTMSVNPCFPLNSRTTVTVRGWVQGILGALAWDGTTFTFTRDVAGQFATVLGGGVKFITENGVKYRGYDQIFWPGRNGVTNTDRIVTMTRAMVNYHTVVNPRFLVLQILPSTDTVNYPDPSATNWALSQEFAGDYVRVADWLMSDAAAAAIGYTLTADDRADIANGFTPRGYRGSDVVHINSLGRAALAIKIENEYVARGWN